MKVKLNVSRGSEIKFQINSLDYTETIRQSSHDPNMPGYGVVCVVSVPEGIKVGDMVLMPDIEGSGNCGNVTQHTFDKEWLTIRIPQSAVDLDSIGN